MRDVVSTIYRDPFSLGTPTAMGLRPGASLLTMVERMPHLPRNFAETGEIRINDHPVPRGIWGLVKPKPTQDDRPIHVTFHAAIRGGGGDSGKSGVALISALVITVAAIAVSGGILGPTGALSISGSLFAAGSTSALIAAGAVSIIGGLILTALTPPPALPSIDGQSFDRDQRGAASAGGNVLEPNGPIPRVIGTRKVFPPLAAEPFTYFSGDDEYVEAVYVLAGPHDMSDIRIDGTHIENASDLVYEVREGWPDDSPLTIAQRQTRTAPVQIELSVHTVKPDEQNVLDGIDPTNLPTFHGTSGRYAPDELQLHLVFAGGLSVDGVVTDKLRVPFRLRMRLHGSPTWINLPELHYENATLRRAQATIRLIFQDGEHPSIEGVPDSAGWVEARKLSTGQTGSPPTDDWEANSYFSTGAGDDYLTKGTEGSTKVTNINLTQNGALIYLDAATFTPGIYEVEIKRGCAFKKTSYVASAYTYGGTVLDFFHYFDSGTIPETRENVIDACHLLRNVSVWNEKPIMGAGFATIAIRAVNRRVERVSIRASGYVKDWSGSDWDTWVITSNPAPHFRDVLVGGLNLDPLPEVLLDDASIVDWRSACTTLDYTCDHIAEGERVAETLMIIAGCGYARQYQSELWGVIRDYDRSLEGPVQVFSPRNSRDFKWSKAFARLPDGLRINLQDEDIDYSPSQLIVYHDGVPGPKLEQVTYQGLTTIAKARARAEFDLAQARLRATIYSLTAPAEAVVCRRGSLVGVNQDVLHNQAGFGRVSSVQTSGANVTGVTLDGDVSVWNENNLHVVTDMHNVTDMHLVGRRTGVAIRRTDGSTSVHLLSNSTEETDVLTFEAPVPNYITAGGPFDGTTIPEIDVGCLAVVGNWGQEYSRLLVSTIEPGPELTATLTFVDEAQSLWPLVFSPVSLFVDGEEGVIFNVSDVSTLWTDTTGTTAAGSGDQVARIDDKSGNGHNATQATAAKRPRLAAVPSELGDELVTNPRFTADTDWIKGTGWTIASGKATKTAGTAASLSQTISFAAGGVYAIMLNVVRTAGTLQVQFTGGSSVLGYAFNENRTHVEVFVAVTGNTTLELYGDAAFAGSVKDVSVRQATEGAFTGLKFDGIDNLIQTADVNMSGSQKMTIGLAHWRDDGVGIRNVADVLEYVATATTGSLLYRVGTTPTAVSRDIDQNGDGASLTEDRTALSETRTHIDIFEIDFSQAALADQIKIRSRGIAPPQSSSGTPLTVADLPSGSITLGAGFNGLGDYRGTIRRFVAINRLLTATERADLDGWLSAGVPRIAVLGDSTVGDNRISAGQASDAWRVSALLAGVESGGADVSEPGDKIADQQTAWNALTDYSALDAVFIQVGLNDANTYAITKTSAQIIADLQGLVDTVAGDVPASCKIAICALTPARAWLGNATNPALAYAHWQAINTAIVGGGATPITGVNARLNSYVALLADGSDNLHDDYDFNDDGVHPSMEGKWIIASAWRAQLVAWELTS